MQPREPEPRPPRPAVPDVPSFPQGTSPSACSKNASMEEMISYLMQQNAYQQQQNAYQQQQNAYQQELNQYAVAKFRALEWDISEIHNKFNMREAMEKYEEGIYYLLEFGVGWDEEQSGIPSPERLADISYLRQSKHATERAKVNDYLTQFGSFRKYFKNLDELLLAMKAWSTQFKQPANTFSHVDHPQTADMPEMLIRIGKHMSELGLEELHSDVINKTSKL